jgi:two-component system, NarL family, sensor histidine kinase UhpB
LSLSFGKDIPYRTLRQHDQQRNTTIIRLIKLLVIIGLVQAVYWLLIDRPLFGASQADAPISVEWTSTEIARLPEPSLAAAARAAFKPAEIPFTHCCDAASFAVKMKFRQAAIPAEGLGIISTLQVDNYLMAVNGTTLFAEGRLTKDRPSFHGQQTYLARIPGGLLRPGENELTYITVRSGFPYTDIYPPLVGPYNAVRDFSAARLWQINDFTRYSAIVLGLLGLLAAVMVFRSDDWKFAAWLSALCTALVANYGYNFMLDPPVDGWGRMVAYFAINMLIPAALLCFIDAWTGRSSRALQWGAVGLYAAAVAYISWRIYFTEIAAAYDAAALVWSWVLMILSVATILRILVHFVGVDEDRWVEGALLSVGIVATMLDAVGKLLPELGWAEGNLQAAAPFLLLAMVVAFLARNFRLFQSQGALNAMLQAKVTQRESELAEASAREKVLVRQQAHDAERRRIMQDLHDGLGSQLMAMMLSARLGEAEPAKVASGLQAVIDEMRLMVDSMDSVGESLGAALATFRARVEPRVKAAGFAFHWNQPNDVELSGYGPRDVLQIFRVLQEAVTNAMKHSGGDAITVGIEQIDDNLSLTVSDNGVGTPPVGASQAGRGLSNMAQRARAVGGRCEVGAGQGAGTCVTLTLPQRAATDLAPAP